MGIAGNGYTSHYGKESNTIINIIIGKRLLGVFLFKRLTAILACLLVAYAGRNKNNSFRCKMSCFLFEKNYSNLRKKRSVMNGY